MSGLRMTHLNSPSKRYDTGGKLLGITVYPEATELLVAADRGGSNGSRVRFWKVELQRRANELGMTIHVHHLSFWNE